MFVLTLMFSKNIFTSLLMTHLNAAITTLGINGIHMCVLLPLYNNKRKKQYLDLFQLSTWVFVLSSTFKFARERKMISSPKSQNSYIGNSSYVCEYFTCGNELRRSFVSGVVVVLGSCFTSHVDIKILCMSKL